MPTNRSHTRMVASQTPLHPVEQAARTHLPIAHQAHEARMQQRFPRWFQWCGEAFPDVLAPLPAEASPTQQLAYALRLPRMQGKDLEASMQRGRATLERMRSGGRTGMGFPAATREIETDSYVPHYLKEDRPSLPKLYEDLAHAEVGRAYFTKTTLELSKALRVAQDLLLAIFQDHLLPGDLSDMSQLNEDGQCTAWGLSTQPGRPSVPAPEQPAAAQPAAASASQAMEVEEATPAASQPASAPASSDSGSDPMDEATTSAATASEAAPEQPSRFIRWLFTVIEKLMYEGGVRGQ